MTFQKRNNVHVALDGSVTLVFVHGFGFDQSVWRYLTDGFADRYRVVLLDLVGSGQSDAVAYDFTRHRTLHAHANDLLEILGEYCSGPIVFIGHSVGSTIGMLASIKAPERFSALVMIAPSPSLVNDGDYIGGFERGDIESLLESLENNYLGWSSTMAPAVLGMQAQPAAGAEFASAFCRNDPEIGKHFARVTFLADHRADLVRVTTPTLILQGSADPFVPVGVGEHMHSMIRGSALTIVESTGHCPHINAPRACIEAIVGFLDTISLIKDGPSNAIVSDN